MGNTLLHATSHHPWPLIRGIPTGQFLRLHRNCSNIKDFYQESKELRYRFRVQGYPNSIIRQGMKKALHKSREHSLGFKDNIPQTASPPQKNKKIRVVTTYGTHWNQLSAVLTKHWHILLLDRRLKVVVNPQWGDWFRVSRLLLFGREGWGFFSVRRVVGSYGEAQFS